MFCLVPKMLNLGCMTIYIKDGLLLCLTNMEEKPDPQTVPLLVFPLGLHGSSIWPITVMGNACVRLVNNDLKINDII